MGLDERLGWLLLGCVIGFILGYIVRSLREIKDELDEIAHHEDVNTKRHIVSRVTLMDFILLVVVAFTMWSIISTYGVSHDVKETQSRLTKTAFCNQEYLKAQAEFLSVYLENDPGPTPEQRAENIREYLESIETYMEAVGADTITGKDTELLPDKASLADCKKIND